MTLDIVGMGVGLLLLVIGFAFGLGRRRGRREGMEEGLLAAPLELRRVGLELGTCVLCGDKGGQIPEEDVESQTASNPEG